MNKDTYYKDRKRLVSRGLMLYYRIKLTLMAEEEGFSSLSCHPKNSITIPLLNTLTSEIWSIESDNLDKEFSEVRIVIEEKDNEELKLNIRALISINVTNLGEKESETMDRSVEIVEVKKLLFLKDLLLSEPTREYALSSIREANSILKGIEREFRIEETYIASVESLRISKDSLQRSIDGIAIGSIGIAIALYFKYFT